MELQALNEAGVMFPTPSLEQLGRGEVREKRLDLHSSQEKKAHFATGGIEVGGECLGSKVVWGSMDDTGVCLCL